jgi:hypothetical protein
MDSLLNLFHQYPWIIAVLGWGFSAAVSTMPAPTTSSSPYYIWLHNFLQVVGANIKQVKLPNAAPDPQPKP